MAVYNLGQVGTEDPIGKALSEWNQSLDQRQLMKQQIEGQKEIAKMQTLENAKQMLAQEELKKGTRNSEMFAKTWQALSDKPQEKRDMFLQTDSGKEYLKTAKKYIPEVFDTEGKPIFFPSTEEKIRTELDQTIDATKMKLIQNPSAITEGERKILEMEGYKDEVTQASADLWKSPDFQDLMAMPDELYNRKRPELGTNAEVAQKMLQSAIQQRVKMRQSQEPGAQVFTPLEPASDKGEAGYRPVNMSEWSTPLAGNQTPVSSLAKPKSTRFKVTPLK